MAGTGQDDKPFEKHVKVTGTPSVCPTEMLLWYMIRSAHSGLLQFKRPVRSLHYVSLTCTHME